MNTSHKLQALSIEKIKRNFTLINSIYFSEIIYDENNHFFDLYLKIGANGNLTPQIKTITKTLLRTINYDLNSKVCGLKAATILIQENYKTLNNCTE